MKKLLILTSFILCAAYGFAQTTIIGGAGVIAGRNNPNSLTSLDYQDPRYEGLLYNDTLTGILYRHDNSLAFGSRWVSMASISEVDGSITNEGALSVGAAAAATSQIITNTSGDGGVILKAAGILTTAESADTITLTATEVDALITNEGALSVGAGASNSSQIATNTSGDGGVFIKVAGINTISESADTMTVTATEVDGSVTNEGVLGVGAGGANTAVALSTTSGATGITIDGGTAKGISVTESTSANGGTITLGLGVLTAYANDAAAATGGLAVGDWYKASSDNTMGMAAGTPKIRAF